MNKEQYRQTEDLVREFNGINNNLGFNGGTQDNDEAGRNLSIANKKLALYADQFGTNNKFFKDFKIISQKAAIRLDENKRFIDYI